MRRFISSISKNQSCDSLSQSEISKTHAELLSFSQFSAITTRTGKQRRCKIDTQNKKVNLQSYISTNAYRKYMVSCCR